MPVHEAVSSYHKIAEEFLARHGIKFHQEFVGKDCPRFCEDAINGVNMDKTSTFPRASHIHGYHYRCTLTKSKPCEACADSGTQRAWWSKPLVIDFWNSYNDEEFNYLLGPFGASPQPPDSLFLKHGFKDLGSTWRRPNVQHADVPTFRPKPRQVPRPYDLLACMTKSDPDTFEDFCGDFGYDTDSRRAHDIYLAVQNEWQDVQRFFTPEEIAELQEIS